MTKIQIDGKEVNAEVCNNVAVFKRSGYRCRHYPTGMLLGDPHNKRVFDSKEQAISFAWAIQERLDLNVNSKEGFKSANGDLTFREYCDMADEEYERSKI